MYSGGGRSGVYKHFKGDASCKSFGTTALGFTTDILYTFNIYLMHATYISHSNLIDLIILIFDERSWGTSGSIVSGYGLDDRAIKIRSPAEAQGIFFSDLCAQTGSGVHPASCTMGTGGVLSPGVERGRGMMLTSHPYLVPRS
jgi:hypothetical protein